MSRYNTIIKNDVTNGEGICVSFFVQGCPHHCFNCFNEEAWDFSKGQEYTSKTRKEILDAIGANGIERNFSILGGEPLAPQNLKMVRDIIVAVHRIYPKIKIFLWTGYTFEKLLRRIQFEREIKTILYYVDVLIDGPYMDEEKDLSLQLRGSKNQKIREKENGRWMIKTQF